MDRSWRGGGGALEPEVSEDATRPLPRDTTPCCASPFRMDLCAALRGAARDCDKQEFIDDTPDQAIRMCVNVAKLLL